MTNWMTAAGLALIAGGLATLIGFRHLLWGGAGRRRSRPQRAIEPARRMALGATPHVPEARSGERPAEDPAEPQPARAARVVEAADAHGAVAPASPRRGRRAGRRRASAALAAGSVPEPRTGRRFDSAGADAPADAPAEREWGDAADVPADREWRDAADVRADREAADDDVDAPAGRESSDDPGPDVRTSRGRAGDAEPVRRRQGGLARIGLADDEDPSGDLHAPIDADADAGADADLPDETVAIDEDAVADLEPVAETPGEPAGDDTGADATDAGDHESAEPEAERPEPVADARTNRFEGTRPVWPPTNGSRRAHRFGDPAERRGDRVDGWVRPSYHDDDIDLSVSGEYWTPAPRATYDAPAGYGWPVPVERLAAVPPRPGFDADVDLDPELEPADPTAVVPQWPPAQPTGRIELPRSWATRDRQDDDPDDDERGPAMVRRPSRSERRRGSTDATELLPSVDDPADGAPRPDRRPRPRPRPSQPERSTVYRSRHAAD